MLPFNDNVNGHTQSIPNEIWGDVRAMDVEWIDFSANPPIEDMSVKNKLKKKKKEKNASKLVDIHLGITIQASFLVPLLQSNHPPFLRLDREPGLLH